MEERQDEMERYAKEWAKYTKQYNEAKMAVDHIAEWQMQIEQQQREASELARVEANRMRSLWDHFVQENDQRWKNEEVDQDQQWSALRRREKQVSEQIQEMQESIGNIQKDKEVLWRIQTAQADAIKKWPRLWLEEIEKAFEHNPESRRQPALVPVREE